MCSRTVMVRCVCTHRQAIGAEPRGVVIDFGCAQELAADGTLTVSQAYTRTFTLEGNQYGRAPELFMELEAAKREVIAAKSTARCTLVPAMSSVSCLTAGVPRLHGRHNETGSRRGAAVRQAAEL